LKQELEAGEKRELKRVSAGKMGVRARMRTMDEEAGDSGAAYVVKEKCVE